MKLNYSSSALANILETTVSGNTSERLCTHVVYDTRKIIQAKGALFFALEDIRDGHTFIEKAYALGVVQFVVKYIPEGVFPDAQFFVVSDPLSALQKLAKYHRSQYSIPVFAITGSIGKTTFKEWLFHCISDRFKVIRSPKSFNSQLGVALSLLEITSDASIALIEAGISKPGEMSLLKEMIQPDYGVFTHFGTAHRENFADKEQHLLEKWKLFSDCRLVWIPESFQSIADRLPGNFQVCNGLHVPQFPAGFSGMLGELATILQFLQYSKEDIDQKLASLPSLALRMEVFDGIQGNTIINDTYNMDADALVEALQFQQTLAGNRRRVVILGISPHMQHNEEHLIQLTQQFAPIDVVIVKDPHAIDWTTFENAVILIKASRDLAFEQLVSKAKAIKHRTHIEINLSAIKHNLNHYRQHLPGGTKILCMVKAWAYGTGSERISLFLQQLGMDYLGVAFADEGVQLRKAGVTLPIVVMNPDPEYVDLIVDHQLEPAIYDFLQLDSFITSLVHRQISAYPIHLKFDTGMHRMGFMENEKEKVLAILHAQPEVKIQGIYSHLADADNEEHHDFSERQMETFDRIVSFFKNNYATSFLAHLLNSEGALRFPNNCYDMIRVGISMYGYTENTALKTTLHPAISWKTAVSQIKRIPKGDFIGYACSYEATNDMEIAILPVGYADGFRRSLSNGVGSVVIRETICPVVGRVCMDTIMVDVTGIGVQINDEVELIGKIQTMESFAKQMGTIPYEILTGLSKRMHRNYIDE